MNGFIHDALDFHHPFNTIRSSDFRGEIEDSRFEINIVMQVLKNGRGGLERELKPIVLKGLIQRSKSCDSQLPEFGVELKPKASRKKGGNDGFGVPERWRDVQTIYPIFKIK